MVQKLFIQDWENFSDREQNNIKELITISLRAIELRFDLLSDSADNLLNEGLGVTRNVVSEGLEVTSNADDPDAKSINEVLPRVGAFLSARTEAIDALKKSINSCTQACDDQYPDDKNERQKCKKNCAKNRADLAKILSLGSFI